MGCNNCDSAMLADHRSNKPAYCQPHTSALYYSNIFLCADIQCQVLHILVVQNMFKYVIYKMVPSVIVHKTCIVMMSLIWVIHLVSQTWRVFLMIAVRKRRKMILRLKTPYLMWEHQWLEQKPKEHLKRQTLPCPEEQGVTKGLDLSGIKLSFSSLWYRSPIFLCCCPIYDFCLFMFVRVIIQVHQYATIFDQGKALPHMSTMVVSSATCLRHQN